MTRKIIMAGNWNQSVTGGYGDADFNGDGIVSIGDLSMLAGNWGWEHGDFDDTSTVDILDLSILANHYGWTTAAAGRPIPEPATILIVTAAGLPMLLKRRRNA